MKRWQFWVGILISAVFLYFTLRGMHLGDFWQTIKTAKYWWLIPGVAVYFVGVWVRSWRWHYMLRPLKKISTRKMFPIVCIGYMGNNIYPARAGELLRDDLEAKGPVRVSDVENAQKEILTIARRMAEAGEIVLGSKGGEEMI
jgi:hypothetical protein